LQFLGGEVYAGQSVDVTRRYVQHRKTHSDIESLCFKPVPGDKLDQEEREVIWTLEQRGFRLRNITFTSTPIGETDFDLVMPTDEQARWLSDPSYVDCDRTRVNDMDLRRKHSRKLQQMLEQPQADDAL